MGEPQKRRRRESTVSVLTLAKSKEQEKEKEGEKGGRKEASREIWRQERGQKAVEGSVQGIPLGQMSGERKDQRQSQRKRRERKKKSKRGGEEKFLRVGERKMMMKSFKDQKRRSGVEEASCEEVLREEPKSRGAFSREDTSDDFTTTPLDVPSKRALDEETMRGDGMLLQKRFHRTMGVAATAPAVPLCTESFSLETEDVIAPDCPGLGRAAAEKELQTCEQGLIGMGDIGIWLQGRIGGFVEVFSKVKPTGKVFPLPSSFPALSQCFPHESPPVLALLRSLVLSLNSLNGEGLSSARPMSPFQHKILGNLLKDCRRVQEWKERAPPVTWEEFFKVRGIDYRGEEVLCAQSIRWENLAPALPAEVGNVPLEEVVELGSREFVLNFNKYLLDPGDQMYTRPPKVMVAPEHWETLCENLLQRGVFAKIHEDEVYKVDGKLVLNGLFGVSKHEFEGEFEVMRLIMNLIPANRLVRSLDSDIATLPSWASMSPLGLMPDEDLLISSEDVRCFFYIFRLPPAWYPLMAFNRPLPPRLSGEKTGKWYPCAAVLPMGFKNSVSLAQHVHRFITRRALGRARMGGELEIRKDKTFSSGNPLFRIYLDNFDELMKVSRTVASAVAGTVSPLVSCLREEYAILGVPRHPKKAVSSATLAEVQGAVVDGVAGLAYPKPEKVLRYALLTKSLLEMGACSQKQAQVVGGGLVYLAMFRRPLLGCLNALWKFIVLFENYPPVIRLPIPKEVKLELARFLGLIPLAFMDFRCTVSKVVTASDASKTGGGVTASVRASPVGCMAAQCAVRGDLVEPADVTQVFTIGLFDGIAALRVAVDALRWNIVGHVSVEKNDQAARVVEARFPNSLRVEDVTQVDQDMVRSWAMKFSQAGLVAIGAGPPCQGVSGLSAGRKGALRDARSCLFVHVSRIRDLVKRSFPWAQVRTLMESVASMDQEDQDIMSKDFGDQPWFVDAQGVSLARRPRLYWIDWELLQSQGASLVVSEDGRRSAELKASLVASDFLLPGWSKFSPDPLPTFTTARPRSSPGYKPAGLQQCTKDERTRWVEDKFRFPPYQYRSAFCLINKQGLLRVPSIEEREVIMGFPRNYTMMCMGKQHQGSEAHMDCRLSLIGNSWNVTVIAWLLAQLGSVLGLNPSLSTQEIFNRTSPGCTSDFQTFLQRPFMKVGKKVSVSRNEGLLVSKLLTLVSIKGEDLMLQSSSEDQVKYHRLRASVPAKLWVWKTITGWKWRDVSEHINVLEMRAVLTAMRWRIEKQGTLNSKFVHLIDSLVCLHSLSRGRSSSLKLKRSLLRINSLLLATNCHVVWAYVHTKDNPADAPSRRPRKRKWSHAEKAS